jgi:fluoroacetyl-CoA thioesterase
MQDSLKPGLATTRRITIDRPRTIDFMGDEGRVYATPELVRDIENTCRDLLLEHADAGEDSVGTRIEVDHVAATPLGLWVEITATVAAVDGRRVELDIAARDNLEAVARGKHARFMVSTARTAERLKAKMEKALAL